MTPESVVQGRLVGFLRISSNNSELDSQKEVVARFSGRIGNFIRRWYEDPHRPRWKAEHSEVLRQLLRDAEERQFDWIVIDKQQRLGTIDHVELYHYIYQFRMAGVRIWSVQEGELTSNEIAASFKQVAQSQSEIAEQKTKAGNVARGMFANAKKFRYNGAVLPHGYDRLCVSPEGVERFRLVEDGRAANPRYVRGSKHHDERRYVCRYTVIYPNGHTEKLTQLPGKGKHDRYEYALSVRENRIAAVRLVFRLYLQGFNRTEIAAQLNRERYDAGFRVRWHSSHVAAILEHPIYTGRHVWKKETQAAYLTIGKDGEYVEAVWSKADPKSRRKGVPDDERIVADVTREDLRVVSDEDFAKAQARLERERGQAPAKRPRHDGYWIRPFLACGHCGGGMVGQRSTTRKPSGRVYHKGYFRCSHYGRTQEAGVELGCVANSVRQESVEAALAEFLDRYGDDVGRDEVDVSPRLAHLMLPFGQKGASLQALRDAMLDYVLERAPVEQHDLIDVAGGIPLVDAYRHYYEEEARSLQAEVDAIEAEIAELAISRVGLPKGGVADRALVARITEREADAERLRDRVVPLDRRIDALSREMREIEEAIKAVSSHAAAKRTRQAADALARVVSKVEVFSVEADGYQKEALRWVPDRLIFHPVVGAPVEIKLPWPGHLVRPEAVARMREILAGQAAAGGKVNIQRIGVQVCEEGLHGNPVSVGSIIRLLGPELAALPPGAMNSRIRLPRQDRGETGDGRSGRTPCAGG